MKWHRMAAFAIAVVTLAGSSLFAVTGEEVKLKIERVALFKNGLGYFVSNAKLPEKTTHITFGQLPVPSLGTFWVGYSGKVKVRGLFAGLEEIIEQAPAQTIPQLLAANIGSRVRIHGPGEGVVQGSVLAVTDGAPAEPASPYVMGVRRSDRNRRRGRSLVLIKTDDGVVSFDSGAIKRADVLGDAVETSAKTKAKRPSLRMELEEAAGGEEVAVSYLARGVTWSPSYFIDLSDPKTARLSAKALVINEVADLDGVTLELISGFPNIGFADVSSPMAMGQSLADFLNALSRGADERRRRPSHVMAQQAVMYQDARVEEWPGMPGPGYSTAREGRAAADLFFYPVEDFTLGRGETAYLPLFTAEVPYQHVYVWNIPDFLDREERYRRERERPDRRFAEEVWHCCRATNNMKMPWTTAPAQFVTSGRIVGQDICYYTAAGAQTTIRINRAMNLLAEQAEFEIDRQRNAATFYGRQYDRVKVKGELKLINRLEKNVNVEVTKDLSGEVIETSPQAKDVTTAKGLKRVNTGHRLTWSIELEAGEETTLTYVYEVFVRP